MIPVNERKCRYRRGRPLGLDGSARISLKERLTNVVDYRNRFTIGGEGFRRISATCNEYEFIRLQSTKIGVFGVTIMGFVVIILCIANLVSIWPKSEKSSRLNLDVTCHSKDPDPYRYYGTKTSYHIAVKNYNELDLPLEECTPVAFYLLSRHATRYPDEVYILHLMKLLPALKKNITDSFLAGKSKLCKEDLEKIEKFQLNMKNEDGNKISTTGAIEAENLGRRLKQKFYSILDGKYSPEKFTIEYTSRDRTRVTAENFAKGLFGEGSKKINFDGKFNDRLLNFHNICKNLGIGCKGSIYDVSEINKFKDGTLMQQVVESVSERIGVNIRSDEIQLLYRACSFGYALNHSDAWCSIFSQNDLKVLEFNDDIDDYYKDAYGNEVNYNQACPIAAYIFNLFKSVKNSNVTKVVLHFSHAGGIKKVYSMFGLFHDEFPLTADSFYLKQNRKWRSSLISPFNSNIILVLYHCGGEYKVATFHNEKPVKLNGCDDELCSFSKFSATYEPVSKACNISKICCSCC